MARLSTLILILTPTFPAGSQCSSMVQAGQWPLLTQCHLIAEPLPDVGKDSNKSCPKLPETQKGHSTHDTYTYIRAAKEL